MKSIMIAALVAAPISAAAPTSAAEPPRDEIATQQDRAITGPGGGEGVELSLSQAPAPALRDGDAPSSAQTAPAQETEGKKRKSTGDKVLTGAAIILGIGALAVGGLLVAIFAQ
jgi:hypothetical protein